MKFRTKFHALALLALLCLVLTTAFASAEAPMSSDFTSMTREQVKDVWTIDGEVADAWKVTSDGLVINTREGEMWTSSNVASNFFRQDANGNFTAEVKIDFEKPLPSALQTVGIMVSTTDLNNYIRLVVVYEHNGHYLQWRAEDNGGIAGEVWGPDLGTATTVWLRLKKVGDVYTGYYSTDGELYTAIAGEYAKAYTDPKLYMVALNSPFSPGSESIDVTFEYCNITELDEHGNGKIMNTVVVNNGTGDGKYAAGDAVTITADAAPAGQEFIGWTGLAGLEFTSGDASTTTVTFIMPDKGVTATACYATAGVLPVSCDFTNMNAAELKSLWSVYKSGSEHWEDTKLWRLDAERGLVLTSRRADIYAGDNYCPNIFTQGGDGNWIAETKVYMDKPLTVNYQGVYLMAFQDSDNYVKMIYAMNGGNGCQLLFEQNGAEIRSFGLGGVGQPEAIWLRLKKVGNTYYGYASTNGVDYVAVGDGYEMVMTNPKVALTALNGRWSSAPDFEAGFEYLKIEELDSAGNRLDKDLEIVFPSVDKQINVVEGKNGVLSAVAPYADSYQWFINRNDGEGYVKLDGATNAVYTTNPVKLENEGFTYYCLVKDETGSKMTPVYTLRVTPYIEVPDTGDHFSSTAVIILCVAAMMGIVGLVVFSRRKAFQH